MSARACCVVIEENNRAAKVAFDWMLKFFEELGFLLRIDCGITNLFPNGLWVLGVGVESKTFEPKKLEERTVLVAEAIDGAFELLLEEVFQRLITEVYKYWRIVWKMRMNSREMGLIFM